MRKLTSEDFNFAADDMSFDPVEVSFSGRYTLIMRPLSVAMINACAEETRTFDMIRFSIVDVTQGNDDLGIEMEQLTFAGREYTVATLDSVRLLNIRMVEALTKAALRVSYLSQREADKTDFTQAGTGTETQTPTVSE